jgi:hypothetical protein
LESSFDGNFDSGKGDMLQREGKGNDDGIEFS